MRTVIGLLVVLCVLVDSRPAAAWGFEAHRYIVSRAIPLLPREIQPFFDKYRDTIVEHTIDPDLWRTAGWEAESPRHFLNMDAYGPYPFSQFPRDFDQTVSRYGAEFVTRNGLLPWRGQEIYDKLVDAFRQQAPYSRDNIKFFSSVLSHYVCDAHVPFHAALNHDGQLTGQWGIHSRFESELFERYRQQLNPRPAPVVRIREARDFLFDTLVASFSHVGAVLAADKAAVAGREIYDDGYFASFYKGVGPVLKSRLAASMTATASLIASAWEDAGRPALSLDQTRTPRKVRRK